MYVFCMKITPAISTSFKIKKPFQKLLLLNKENLNSETTSDNLWVFLHCYANLKVQFG